MGTLAASNFRTLPGNMPGGILRTALVICAVTCATAISICTLGWKIDPDDRDAVVGLRLDVFDVVDVGGEAALEVGDDALLHFVGREAAVLPEDADDGDVDIGENIDRHGDDGGSAQDGDEDRHDDEGIGAAEG